MKKIVLLMLLVSVSLFACAENEVYDYDLEKCVVFTEDMLALNPKWAEFN